MRPVFGSAMLFGLFAAIAAFSAVADEIGPTELAYDNDDVGIHADAPAGTVICQPTNVGSNHGFFIPLDPSGPVDCNAEPSETRIDFFFAYNAVYFARSTGEMAAHDCEPSPYKPSPFFIDRLRAMECIDGRVARRHKRRYVVLRPYRSLPGRPDEEMQPSLDVIVELICPHGNCDKYTPQLKQLFKSTRSIPLRSGPFLPDDDETEHAPN